MKRCRLVLTLLILLLATVCSATLGSGTTAAVTVEVTWTVVPFQSLAIAGDDSSNSTVTSRFDLHQPTEIDFARGYIEKHGALTLVATSNIPWTVKVHAIESDMGTSDDGTYVKPLSDFSLRANGRPYSSVTRFDQPLAGGDRGTHTLIIDYRILTEQESYKEGNYGLTLVYTIISD